MGFHDLSQELQTHKAAETGMDFQVKCRCVCILRLVDPATADFAQDISTLGSKPSYKHERIVLSLPNKTTSARKNESNI